jgi:hypothetical protein
MGHLKSKLATLLLMITALTLLIVPLSGVYPLSAAAGSSPDDSVWSVMNSNTTAFLQGVWGSSATDVFAVGYWPVGGSELKTGCIILHYDGNAWSTMMSGGTFALYDIWGSSATDVFAVGDCYPDGGGIILHYNGIAWSNMNIIAGQLFGVWGSSATDVYAVGPDAILHYDGSAWSTIKNDSTVEWWNSWGSYYDIWGSSATDVFVVGPECFLHYNGSAWSTMSWNVIGAPNPNGRGIWGSSATDVFVVHSGNTLLHYDGKTLNTMIHGNGGDLQNIWGSSDTNVFAVGASYITRNYIVHYDGSTWSAMNLNENPDGEHSNEKGLQGIWGSSATDVFAVGYDGTILHYSPTNSAKSLPIWLWIVVGGIAVVVLAGFVLYRNKGRLARETANISQSKSTRGDTNDAKSSSNVRCPICGSNTSIRVSKKGSNAGRKFYLCSQYPECNGRIPVRSLKHSIPSDSKDDWQDW